MSVKQLTAIEPKDENLRAIKGYDHDEQTAHLKYGDLVWVKTLKNEYELGVFFGRTNDPRSGGARLQVIELRRDNWRELLSKNINNTHIGFYEWSLHEVYLDAELGSVFDYDAGLSLEYNLIQAKHNLNKAVAREEAFIKNAEKLKALIPFINELGFELVKVNS